MEGSEENMAREQRFFLETINYIKINLAQDQLLKLDQKWNENKTVDKVTIKEHFGVVWNRG